MTKATLVAARKTGSLAGVDTLFSGMAVVISVTSQCLLQSATRRAAVSSNRLAIALLIVAKPGAEPDRAHPTHMRSPEKSRTWLVWRAGTR